MSRVFLLVTDAFGGYGGIALYNRDVITSLCMSDRVAEVSAVARWQSQPLGDLPRGLVYSTKGTSGWLAYIWEVMKKGIKSKTDLIVCCHINLLPIAFLLNLFLRKPIVLQIYGFEAWQPTPRSITNLFARHVDAVVSISEYTLSKYVNWSKVDRSRCHVLPNAIHLDEFSNEANGSAFRKEWALEDSQVLLTFGRLVSRERAKGFDEVMDVLPAMILEFPRLVYVVAGEGPDKERLREKARKLGLEKQVVFTGMVDESRKNELYNAADVFVMPSRGEGFGFVFLEALACGVPAVGSTMDGSREALLQGRLGQLVNPDESEALKAAIRIGLKTEKSVPAGLSELDFPHFSAKLSRILEPFLAN